MTDLSELLLIMIRAGISLLPQCQTLSRSLNTQSQIREIRLALAGPLTPHAVIKNKNTIQSQVLRDNNVTIIVM